MKNSVFRELLKPITADLIENISVFIIQTMTMINLRHMSIFVTPHVPSAARDLPAVAHTKLM